MTDPVVVRAAGGVLWRDAPAGREIAIVHRPRYDDWSIPKGKCKPGEPLLLTGAREVAEETGFVPCVRAPIGRYSYRLSGQDGPAVKTVRYWSMAAMSGTFLANDEVDELVWVGLAEAAVAVSSLVDRKVLDAFAVLPSPTATLLVGPSCRRSPKPLDGLLRHLGVARMVSSATSSNDTAFDRYAERTGLSLDTALGRELAAASRHPSAPAVRRLLKEVDEHRAVAVCIDRDAAARLVADVALLCGRFAVPPAGEHGWSLLHLHGDDLLAIERGELRP